MILTESFEKTPFAVFVALSLISTIGAVALFVWLTMGVVGPFWGAFGNKQFLYYTIVVALIMIALCGSWFGRLNLAPFIAIAGVGGYVGGLVAYYCLSYSSLAQMMAKDHYYAIVRPLILPTHIIFVSSGIVASVLLLVGCAAYGTLGVPGRSA